MFQLSFTLLFALSISANLVFTIDLFEADTANLQNESPVGVLKNNNQTKESHKTHEEPSKDVTSTHLTPETDRQKVDTHMSQVKNSSIIRESVTTTLSTQKIIQNVTIPIEATTRTTKEVAQKAGKVSDEQTNMNPPDENKKNVVTSETLKKDSAAAGSPLGTTPLSTVIPLNSTVAGTTTSTDLLVKPNFYPVESHATESIDGSVYHSVGTTLETSKSTIATTITINNTTIPTAVTKATAAMTITTTTTTTTIAPAIANTTVAIANTTGATPAVANTATFTPAIANTTGATDATTALKNNQTKNENDRMAVEKVENVQQAELSKKGKESSDGSNNGSMPPGIIALVTAITFAVAIAIGYISMVVWKQYLEHRYGRRELLVNELEFDTNDLRHFEL